MNGSILNSIKKLCGVDATYTVFDPDFLMHINTVFGTLNQLGIGPIDGFAIEDASAMWDDYIIDNRLSGVKTYMQLRVRILFDPPTSSYVLTSMQEQLRELEWRLEVQRIPVVPAVPISLPNGDSSIYDGGSPDSDNDYVYDGGAP